MNIGGFQAFNFLKIKNPLTRVVNSNSSVDNKGLKTDVFKRSSSVSFKGIPCSTKAFEIREVENMRCPICENIMLNDDQIDKFAGLVQNKKGEGLAEALDKYGLESYWTGEESDKTIYRDKRQEIVDIIKEIALENPNFELSDIVKLRALECAKKLSQKETDVLIELEEFVSKNVKDKNEKANLNYLIAEGIDFASRVGTDAFKRKKFIYSIQDTVKNHAVQEEINKIAQKLPTSTDDTDAFFVKYSKEQRGNFEIASSLVSGAIPTAEHLVCQSDKGGDFIENYLCDCAECNSTRMSTPFNEWIKQFPNLEENLQKHLDEVQGYIDEGRFSHKYDFYPQEVAKTISRISDGKINLKTLDKEDERFKKILSKRAGQENDLKAQIEAMKLEMEEKEKKRDEYKAAYKNLEKHGEKELAKEVKQDSLKYRSEADALRNRIIEVEKELKLLRGYSKKYSYNS